MKLILALVLMFSVSAVEWEVEQNLFGEQSPLAILLKGAIEGKSQQELTSYLKVANQLFPLLTAKKSQDSDSALAAWEYTDNYCFWNGGSHNNFCFYYSWKILVGWNAEQYADDSRFYNLTVTPFASAFLTTNVTWNAAPWSVHVSPYFDLLDFRAPIGVEIVNSQTFCYSGQASLQPIHLGSYLGTSWLQCQADITEQESGSCDFSPLVSARFWKLDFNKAWSANFLEEHCWVSQ